MLSRGEQKLMGKVIRIREDELRRRAYGRDAGACWIVEFMDDAGWMHANDGVPAYASRGEAVPPVQFPITLASCLKYIERQKRYIAKQRRVNPLLTNADNASTLRARNLVSGLTVIA